MSSLSMDVGVSSLLICFFFVEDAYRKEYQITDPKTRQEYNIVVEIIDTAGQEDYSAGLHDKVCKVGVYVT